MDQELNLKKLCVKVRIDITPFCFKSTVNSWKHLQSFYSFMVNVSIQKIYKSNCSYSLTNFFRRRTVVICTCTGNFRNKDFFQGAALGEHISVFIFFRGSVVSGNSYCYRIYRIYLNHQIILMAIYFLSKHHFQRSIF